MKVADVQALVGERFVLRQQLGRGAHASVYEAVDLQRGAPVAIKVMHAHRKRDSDRVRLAREGRVLMTLRHPHIVEMVSLGEDEQAVYLVMERLYGHPLGTVFDDVARSPRLAVRLMSEVAHGLAHAHGLGVVHRDLKPANIFLCQPPDAQGAPAHAKVLDFGIARIRGSALTSAGIMLGTPRYIAPELAMGKQADWRADIYALGVLLWELLAHRPLFAGSTLDVVGRHVNEVPPVLTEVAPTAIPAELAALVAAMLAKRPSERPQATGQLAAAIAELAPACAVGAGATRVQPSAASATSPAEGSAATATLLPNPTHE